MAPEPRGLSRRLSSPLGLAAAVLALLSGTAAAGADPPAAADPLAVSTELLVNERNPLGGVLTGGAPKDAAGYRALRDAGVHTFVDLRSDTEAVAAARAAAEAAGLTYEWIPVSGEAELDLGSARALDAILDEITRYPVAIACSSGNRVGALLAVEAFWLDEERPEAALELGRRAGLTRLEPSVRLLLQLPPAPGGGPAPTTASP